MAEVSETKLPGVGVRHEFTTVAGERVGVLTHRTGRTELVVYHRDDPDASTIALHLSRADTRTLAELLGASQVSEAIGAVQQQIEGLAIDWLRITERSPFANATIADGQLRTRTGVSVVAVLRGEASIAAPGPEHRFEPGDVVVAIGTPEGLEQLRNLLGS